MKAGRISLALAAVAISALVIRAVLERTHRWRADSVIAAGVAVTRRRLDWSPPAELAAWATFTRPAPQERRWLAGYVGGGRSYAGQMINGIQAVSGGRNKVAYALAIGLPAASAGRNPASQRLRRGVRALRQTLR